MTYDLFSMTLVEYYIEKYENLLKFTFHDLAAHLKGFVRTASQILEVFKIFKMFGGLTNIA